MRRAPEFAFGALFLLMLAVSSSVATPANPAISLASQLFEEGNWTACRRECRRILASTPEQETARLLDAICSIRMGGNTERLMGLILDRDVSTRTAHLARYEAARARWKAGEPTQAFALFKTVFEASRETDLFLRAGCSLALLMRQLPQLAAQHPTLANQLESASCLWTSLIWDECRIAERPPRQAWTGKPPRWVISFYRSQVRPAIGSRCSLHPSCSEFAMRALGSHGLLGIPLYGDRAVREPDVIRQKRAPIWIGRRRLYQDPLSEHTCWWPSHATQAQEPTK